MPRSADRYSPASLSRTSGLLNAAGQVAAIVTRERVLGFSALAGGFFGKDLPMDERVLAMEGDRDVIVLTTQRRLVLRAQQNGWHEMR